MKVYTNDTSRLISEVITLLASIKDLTRTHGMDVRVPIFTMADAAIDMLDVLDMDLQVGDEDGGTGRETDLDREVPY